MGTKQLNGILMRAMYVVVIVAMALSLMGASSIPNAPPVWRDKFDTGSLDPAWFWLNENPDQWSLTDQPGYMRIDAAPYPTGGENLLLRSGAWGDFTIETHVLFEPTSDFQFAGLVIYQDHANFLQLGRAFCDLLDVCVGNGIYFDYIRDGNGVDSNFATGTSGVTGEAYLRLRLTWRSVTAFYSQDGKDWRQIGRHELPMSFRINAVGLTSSQNFAGEEIAADFDYFSLTGLPKPWAPFIGSWRAIDYFDGSKIWTTILGPAGGPYSIIWTEDYFSFCGGSEGLATGVGRLDPSNPNVLKAHMRLRCFRTGALLEWDQAWQYRLAYDVLASQDKNGVETIWTPPGRSLVPRLNLRVNYGHDWVESFYEAGHTVQVTVMESDGTTPKGSATAVTEPKDYWNGGTGFQTEDSGWEGSRPNIEPGDWVFAQVDNGLTARVQIGEITGQIDLEQDTITGTISAPWFSQDVAVECLDWFSPTGSLNKTFGSLPADGMTSYSCSWAGEWDIQPGQTVGVGYFGPDSHWVANAFSVPQLVFYINYEEDLVEGDYELGHTVLVTVLDGEGGTKASLSVPTIEMPHWGGAPGFRIESDDWSEVPLDIVPGDIVRAVVDEGLLTTEVRIGEITAEVDVDTDSISGTIDAEWAGEFVNVLCMPWGGPEGTSERTTTVAPDGLSTFTCSWESEWDIQPGESVGVFYYGADLHNVLRNFVAPQPLYLRVNYGHNWVESFYEPGRLVTITVYASDHTTVRATATDVSTDAGGYFQTQPGNWDPMPPDIQPGDWVSAVADNGQTAEVQIGEITGEINLEQDTITGTISAPWFSQDVAVECLDWFSPTGSLNKTFGSMPADGMASYSCSWAGEWDIQPGQTVGVGYFGPDGHWVANAFNAPNPRIVVSESRDLFWTTDFYPGTLDLFIYESANEGAELLWQGQSEADQRGYTIVGYDVHNQDLMPGNYLIVSDGVNEKGVVLERITIEVFDTENDIMAGTAPAGRNVMVVAGMAEAETQATINLIADAESGAWLADFRTISFDITEDMRPWSFAQIFDDDGDANEADTPPLRSLMVGNFSITWSQTNPEEVIYLSWNGSDNLTNPWANPACSGDLEFFGNSLVSENEGTPDFFFGSLVGWGTTGDWSQTDATINIESMSSGCYGSADIPIHTNYQFFDDEQHANLIRVERTFEFGETPYEHDVRAFIPRLYPADGFTQVIHPNASGSDLVIDGTCSYGCLAGDWDGSWFAFHNSITGMGMIVQRATSSFNVGLWLDDDGGSFTNATSFLLLQPDGGFTGTVTETEYLCFYDSDTWIPSLNLPEGCQP